MKRMNDLIAIAFVTKIVELYRPLSKLEVCFMHKFWDGLACTLKM